MPSIKSPSITSYIMKQSKSKNDDKKPRKLEEGKDYYLEHGFFVFTAHFLKERGYCCESGCRHCPYGFDN